jgi:signal transduction histidine kinase
MSDSWIMLHILQEGGQGCVIEVSDNGCGMDEKTMEKIFDPFFTTKSSMMGTGLGLHVCRNLVERLGGYIEVESKPGEGSTFRVVLGE